MEFLLTIQPEHVGCNVIHAACDSCGKPRIVSLVNVIGKVQDSDIGKRVFDNNGTIQVENDYQCDARLNDTLTDPFYHGYAVAALWSSTDESGEGHIDTAGYTIADLAPETKLRMIADCDEFLATIAANGISREMLANLYQPDDGDNPLNWAGHDLWLTRNGHGVGFWDRGFGKGHGVGFWDRGFGKVGDELDEYAQACGAVDLYVGDDGLVYQS